MEKVVVFDAYGTLFDVDWMSTVAETYFPANGKIISRVWRQKQLEYTWLRSLMGSYQTFEDITRDALTFALKQTGKPITDDAIQALLGSYQKLPPYAETEDALIAMESWKRMILSNGTHGMLEALVRHAGLADQFDHLLSVDKVHIYKPHANAYELAVAMAKVPKKAMLFVSSNGWDIAGAKSFGFTVAWVNRTGRPLEELGQQPDFEVANLTELAAVMQNAGA